MAVIIGSARIDERGKASGGAAGDQNSGKEVSTQNWYLHSKGWRVFRAKDPAKAEKIAQDMQYACDNNHIGYDQTDRNTLYDAAKPYKFNCSMVKKNVETDCSALVRICCLYAGIDVPNFNTANEASVLMATGAFTELTDHKYTTSSMYLKRGDILLTKTKGHTAVVLSNGSAAGTSSGTATKGSEGGYMFEVKLVKNGSTGSSVTLCQKLLKVNGYKGSNGKVLAIDGEAGANTVYAIRKFQDAKGLTVDGECGNKTWKKLLGV